MAAVITRLLIANRGEVVCRVVDTAHRLGIETVGVYSDIDENSFHIDHVGVAIRLGGEEIADSYLRGDAILEAAFQTGADGVHPGYGLLAENADFAQVVIDAGMTWVGPKPQQIRLLSDKIAAKNAAKAAGVPTSESILVEPGKTPVGISLPAVVKPTAGRGGIGLRVVRKYADLPDLIEQAAQVALAAFGDDSLFIEPYIDEGRHIEVQILADSDGGVVHLGDRECSIQRRHSKIIEESPAPNLSGSVRSKLHRYAVDLATSVGYEGAGTVEFIVGPDNSITFIEVNTRLQVEHPVTEAVTGIDLVEAQIRIAEGDSLPFAQDEVDIDGHAIEARIVAECPVAGWLPDTGEIEAFELGDRVRVDAGVEVGSPITSLYDTLLAKVIARGPTRLQAIMKLDHALSAAHVAGVETNQQSVISIFREPDFLDGEITTAYLDDHPGVLDRQLREVDETLLIVAASFAVDYDDPDQLDFEAHGQRHRWFDGSGDVRIEYHFDTDTTASIQRGNWPRKGNGNKGKKTGSPSKDGRITQQVRVLSNRIVADGHRRFALEVDGQRAVVQTVRRNATMHVSSPAGSMSLTLAEQSKAPKTQ